MTVEDIHYSEESREALAFGSLRLSRVDITEIDNYSTNDLFIYRADNPEKIEHLAPKEYQILWMLIGANGGFVTLTRILDFIYDNDEEDAPLSNVIEVYVSRVRKKIKKITERVKIEGRIRFGYRLREVNPFLP